MKSIYFREEHEQFRESVREFFAKEADGDRWEQDRRIPREFWRGMGTLGFLGIGLPESYGGSDADFFYSVVFLEELGRLGYAGLGAAVAVQQYVVSPQILHFGTEEQKQRWLVPSIQGEKVGALAISEPDVGSDVAGLRTKAVRDGDDYILNGAKTFITNGVYGDFVVVAARTGGEGSGGISLIVVEHGTEGFSAKPLDKMGWHCSDTGELTFEDARVPASNLLGEENKGFYYIMEGFQIERLTAAIAGFGGSETCLDMTLEYIRSREAFGRPIARFQAKRHRLMELATEMESLRQLIYHTSWLYDQGIHAVKECSMAKLQSSELGKVVADECLQCFGGYGFMEEYPIARMYRDARAGTLAGGTSEIMKEILAKTIIDGVNYEAASQQKPAEAEEGLPSVAEVFATLPGRYQTTEYVEGRVQFDFGQDGNGAFTVVLSGQDCEVLTGLDGEADCLVTCAGELYRDIELGRMAPEAAFMSGQLQVTNIPMMMKFVAGFQRLEKKTPA